MDGAEPGRIYQHYKGGLYCVLHIARHHDSGEPMVVYVSLKHGTINVRPLGACPSDPDGWNTTVQIDGVLQQRFTLMEK